MNYEVKEAPESRGDFVVIAVNEDYANEIYLALFSGPEAKQRAEEYAGWKNKQLEVTGEELMRR